MGSLRVALALFVVIGSMIGLGTIIESKTEAIIAHTWIYKNPLFLSCIVLLCMNLLASTIIRLPWQKKHIGFVMTHYGIILLIIGGFIGLKYGFEGSMTLQTGKRPQNTIVTNKRALQIEIPSDSSLYLLPLDTRCINPSSNNPLLFRIPRTTLYMSIIAKSENMTSVTNLVYSKNHGFGTSILLDFKSNRMNTSFQFALNNEDSSNQSNNFFGRATVYFLKSSDEAKNFKIQNEKPWLLLWLDSNNQLYYRSGKLNDTYSTGQWLVDEQISLGWADWKAILKEKEEHSIIEDVFKPDTTSSMSTNVDKRPGILLSIQDSSRCSTFPRWVVSGKITSFTLQKQVIRLSYGLELKRLPCSLFLENFYIPHDIGTEKPSDFQSNILFRDLKNNTHYVASIHMNHPASWPNNIFYSLIGLSYKFSQAGWNPENPSETTLQVLHDPGWLFKWIGSLILCIGIPIIFYKFDRNN